MRFCVQREGAAHLRDRLALRLLVTELVYGCNCRSANGKTATVRQSGLYSSLNRMVLRLDSGERYSAISFAISGFRISLAT
jgi:hypothetical protein